MLRFVIEECRNDTIFPTQAKYFFEPLKTLIVIVGPTAVGKTDLSIQVAEYFKSEILSADSRQFYRETEIGTAKPTAEELARVPHHFVNSRSIFEPYDVGTYEQEALIKLELLFDQFPTAVMVGGSGLFVDAVCKGLDDLPKGTEELRADLRALFDDRGLVALQEEVQRVDPVYFDQVDRQNPQRLMRALEVYRVSGRPYSSFRTGKKAQRPFNCLKIGLTMDREKLYSRIDQRMDLMIEAGLFNEAESLFPHRALNALQTVGYKEIFGYLNGEYDKEEAIRLLKRNSRRYAKRQLTWFRRDPETQWFEAGQPNEVLSYLVKRLL